LYRGIYYKIEKIKTPKEINTFISIGIWAIAMGEKVRI
jgi:hypothetical protein